MEWERVPVANSLPMLVRILANLQHAAASASTLAPPILPLRRGRRWRGAATEGAAPLPTNTHKLCNVLTPNRSLPKSCPVLERTHADLQNGAGSCKNSHCRPGHCGESATGVALQRSTRRSASEARRNTASWVVQCTDRGCRCPTHAQRRRGTTLTCKTLPLLRRTSRYRPCHGGEAATSVALRRNAWHNRCRSVARHNSPVCPRYRRRAEPCHIVPHARLASNGGTQLLARGEPTPRHGRLRGETITVTPCAATEDPARLPPKRGIPRHGGLGWA